MNDKIRMLDFQLKATTALLVAIGLLALCATSSLKGVELTEDPYYFLKKQLLGISLGLTCIWVIRKVPFSWLSSLTLPLLFGALACLTLVFVPGINATVGGATRWLTLGPLRFQPAELAKIAIIFFLAKNLSRTSCHLHRFSSVMLPNLLMLIAFCALLLKQPDFGSAALLVGLTFTLLYVAGARLRFLSISILIGVTAMLVIMLSSPYRMKRLLSFLDPWSKIQGGGFQIVQSYLAVQNGGLLGVGLGESKQKLTAVAHQR